MFLFCSDPYDLWLIGLSHCFRALQNIFSHPLLLDFKIIQFGTYIQPIPKSSFFPAEMLFSLIGPESDHWLYLSLTHSQTVDLVGRRLYRCDSFFFCADAQFKGGGVCKIKMQILPLTFWLPLNQYRLSKIPS